MTQHLLFFRMECLSLFLLLFAVIKYTDENDLIKEGFVLAHSVSPLWQGSGGGRGSEVAGHGSSPIRKKRAMNTCCSSQHSPFHTVQGPGPGSGATHNRRISQFGLLGPESPGGIPRNAAALTPSLDQGCWAWVYYGTLQGFSMVTGAQEKTHLSPT